MPEDNRCRRYTANLQGEVDSATLYQTLAQTEKHPQLAQVYRRLVAIEEAHTALVRQILRQRIRSISAASS
jgi:vacuolar iron transporter family protein